MAHPPRELYLLKVPSHSLIFKGVGYLARGTLLEGAPDDLLDEKLDELGIDRASFDRDIAQIRRLTPGPVRRTIRRVPDLVGGIGDVLRQTGLGPRMRAWITKEDRSA